MLYTMDFLNWIPFLTPFVIFLIERKKAFILKNYFLQNIFAVLLDLVSLLHWIRAIAMQGFWWGLWSMKPAKITINPIFEL